MMPIWQTRRFFQNGLGKNPTNYIVSHKFGRKRVNEICLDFFGLRRSSLRQVDIDPLATWQKPQVNGHHYRCPCWHLVSSASLVRPDLDHATWVQIFAPYFSMLRKKQTHPKDNKKQLLQMQAMFFWVFEALLDFYCQTLWLIHRLHTANIAHQTCWLRDFFPGGQAYFQGWAARFREGNQIKKAECFLLESFLL